MSGVKAVFASRKGIAMILALFIVGVSFFLPELEPVREQSALILITVVLSYILGVAFEDAALKLNQNPDLENTLSGLITQVVAAVLQALGEREDESGTAGLEHTLEIEFPD